MVFSRLLKGSASVLLLVCLGVAAACDGTSGDTAATGSSGSGFACVPGQTISCTVTPSDGLVNGTPVTLSFAIPLPCTADLNADGKVDAADLAILLGSWGLCG